MYRLLPTVRRILTDGRRYIPSFTALSAIALLMVPVELTALLLSRRLIDQGFLEQNWAVIRSLLAVLFMLFVLRSIVTYATALFSARLQLSINRGFQDRIFAHLIRLPMPALTRQPVGRLMSRIFDDGTRLSSVFDLIFGSVILEPIKLVALAGVLMAFSLRLFALLLVATAASVAVIHWVGNRLDRISKQIQRRDAALFSFVEEMLSNVELIKSKATERRTAKEFRRGLDRLIELSLRIHRVTLIARPTLQLLKFSALGVVLLVGSWMISAGNLSLGTLSVFIGTTLLFFNTLNAIGNTYGRLRESIARLEVVYDLLDTAVEALPARPAGIEPAVVHSIEFRDVGFGYRRSVAVLKGVSFDLRKGEVIGITGQSGSGKTTLIRLLLRFYTPQTGIVRVNGRPLAEFELAGLRAAIGVVFQENLILNDTIRNNIAYGIAEVDDRQVLEAARVAGAHEFIQRLPDGYATVAGEQGRRLSGGQRQRLAIARAVITQPDVLILDEGTSYLELAQEAEILQRIKDRRKDKITVLVTHRPSAIRLADRVLTLDNGRIVDAETISLYKAAKGG
jgi:ABC-type multidrug transport system fused ATPase/permease subunit